MTVTDAITTVCRRIIVIRFYLWLIIVFPIGRLYCFTIGFSQIQIVFWLLIWLLVWLLVGYVIIVLRVEILILIGVLILILILNVTVWVVIRLQVWVRILILSVLMNCRNRWLNLFFLIFIWMMNITLGLLWVYELTLLSFFRYVGIPSDDLLLGTFFQNIRQNVLIDLPS